MRVDGRSRTSGWSASAHDDDEELRQGRDRPGRPLTTTHPSSPIVLRRTTSALGTMALALANILPSHNRLVFYGMVSTAFAAGVVLNVAGTRPGFYSAAVAIARSNGAVMVSLRT